MRDKLARWQTLLTARTTAVDRAPFWCCLTPYEMRQRAWASSWLAAKREERHAFRAHVRRLCAMTADERRAAYPPKKGRGV